MQYKTTNDYPQHFSTIIKNKPNTRFPKIANKPKSLPDDKRASFNNSYLDTLTAKAWLYYTPNAQYGYRTNMKR